MGVQRDVALPGNHAVQDGQPLIDVMYLEAVSEQAAKLRRWEFLLTVAPPPVPMGTRFPINPITTF